MSYELRHGRVCVEPAFVGLDSVRHLQDVTPTLTHQLITHNS